ncbi:hypothetical protein ACJMK2_010343 [Sinanodonta woodiana]|uniref:Uncharacterized protein n=1 Tax=Sinanodonta woodiana TaxID=1069815 RepID=A0ABD3VI44_SINWO
MDPDRTNVTMWGNVADIRSRQNQCHIVGKRCRYSVQTEPMSHCGETLPIFGPDRTNVTMWGNVADIRSRQNQCHIVGKRCRYSVQTEPMSHCGETLPIFRFTHIHIFVTATL